MIREVKIQNYKSIESLDLELGRVNVLIGENGCGKTNILEAIALASAAYSDKLDNEFLVSRGIRVTEPQLMRSAFEKENIDKNINVEILDDTEHLKFTLKHDNELYSKWCLLDITNHENLSTNKEVQKPIKTTEIQKINSDVEEETLDVLQRFVMVIENNISPEKVHEVFQKAGMKINIRRIVKISSLLEDFLVFFPDNTSLRIFEEEEQIQPLGIHGEGLFKFLRFLDMKEDKTRFNEIKERLRLISWFKDFEIPKDLFETERKIYITDKYLDRDLKYFDQRSSNEGFLFTLFYLALFVGEETPKFFAIDNIDNALNPKLCWRVVEELIELAQKYDKQTILTTHNPAILDGLDLHDEEQRLFVVYRNKFGRTRARRIFPPKPIGQKKPIRLSEAFLRGYIGGMPKHF
ncbi:MAG: AAA family ATPase [Cyanobacteria bacterium SBLK]|nr:AAA family ATPase [Cyanobacteria bacterium SBLK]